MKEEILVKLRERQTEITNLLLAIETLNESPNYKLVKSLLFDGLVEKIKSRIQAEGSKLEIDTKELYRLQGELSLARRYADLNQFASTLKVELEGIKNKLK